MINRTKKNNMGVRFVLRTFRGQSGRENTQQTKQNQKENEGGIRTKEEPNRKTKETQ